jgi:hypothetical protein
MTDFDQQRISESISDAFAILCVRVAGFSDNERKLRLGFEAILRQLGTPPLRFVSRAAPPPGHLGATSSDLRFIIHALDACLAILNRYDAVLTMTERKLQILVRATRRFAEDEIRSREALTQSAVHLAPVVS